MDNRNTPHWQPNVPPPVQSPHVSFIQQGLEYSSNTDSFKGQFDHSQQLGNGQKTFGGFGNSSPMNFPEQMRPPLPQHPQQHLPSYAPKGHSQNPPQNVPPYQFQSQPPPPPGPPPSHPPGSFPAAPQGQGVTRRFPPIPPPFLPPSPHQQMQDVMRDPASHEMSFAPDNQRLPPPQPPRFPIKSEKDWSTSAAPGDSMPGQWYPQAPNHTLHHAPSHNHGSRYQHSINSNQSNRRGNQGSDKFAQPRLLPYQSQRSRQRMKDHDNASQAKYQSDGGFGEDYRSDQNLQSAGRPLSAAVKQEREESEDQKWVNEWSKGVQRPKPMTEAGKRREPAQGIANARRMLTKYLALLNQLTERRDKASDCIHTETNEEEWELGCIQMKKLMEELSSLQAKISEPEFVENLKTKIERRKTKRERNRRRRQDDWERREEELRARHERIDARMAQVLQAKQDKEQEEALQKEADQALSEVRRKKQDANRSMELLRGLRKLRNLRKESAEKHGYRSPKELDNRFEQKVCRLEEMMNKQKLLYVDEEKTLQVMLEEEHEETREKERQKKRLRERQRAEKVWEQKLEIMFGKTEVLHLGHPLYMFRQFHQQAENDFQSLVNIRRQWDAFIVPEMAPSGTSIPVSWVIPSEPANHIWATALEEESAS